MNKSAPPLTVGIAIEMETSYEVCMGVLRRCFLRSCGEEASLHHYLVLYAKASTCFSLPHIRMLTCTDLLHFIHQSDWWLVGWIFVCEDGCSMVWNGWELLSLILLCAARDSKIFILPPSINETRKSHTHTLTSIADVCVYVRGFPLVYRWAAVMMGQREHH